MKGQLCCLPAMDVGLIVTGASAGIGEGTAVLFARYGCRLTLTGRDQDRLNAVVQRCVEAGCSADKVWWG